MVEVNDYAIDMLDFQRMESLGEDARLALLNHASSGYTLEIEVLTGWNVLDDPEGDAAGNGQLFLSIAETAEATAARLRKVAAVALLQPGWSEPRVCAVKSKREPLGGRQRVWGIGITPTGNGETFDL